MQNKLTNFDWKNGKVSTVTENIAYSRMCGIVSELKEPDNDDEPVGGAVVVRLQVAVGASRVWRRAHASRAIRPHLEA